MSIPLGAFVHFGESDTLPSDRQKAPKHSKTPNPAKQKKPHVEERSNRVLQLFRKASKRQSSNVKPGLFLLGANAAILTPAAPSTSLARSQSVLKPQRQKHIPIVIPNHISRRSSLEQTCTPRLANPENLSITYNFSPSLYYRPPKQSQTGIDSPPKSKARHLEIERLYTPAASEYSRRIRFSRASFYSQDSSSQAAHSRNRSSKAASSHVMERSTVSSRTSTLDSSTSAPSPDQLYGRKGSSAQLSMTSSQSSLTRDGYASEQDSLHSGYTPNIHQGRSSGASPAIGGTPNPTSNLSGLVCNVHRTTGKEPPGLVGATTTILGDKLYVFGGRRVSRSRPNLTSDLYELDLLHRHWTKISTKGDVPTPRYFHSICPLGDSKLVCYGGMSPDQMAGQNAPTTSDGQESQVSVMSDIHIYDVPSFTWTKVATSDAPQGRYAHCAAILPSSAVFASATAPISAIHNNASGGNPNQGSIGPSIDGAGGAEMIVVGGQDCNNHYIEQISVFNLRSLAWTSTTQMGGRSCGAYRSVVTPLTTMSAAKIGAGPGRPDEEDDEDDADDIDSGASGSPMLVYTNYNFLDVKLELQVRLPDGTLIDKPMQSTVSPPGLRFPSGGIIDNNFVVAGTFLTSSKQEFALWALDLRTLAWARIDTGSSIFSQGSWNRGVLWSRRNAFVILGNRKRNLVEDYNNRRLNFSNLCIVQLEAFGLYDNPRKSAPTSDYISGSAPSIPPTIRVEASIGGRQLSPAAEHLGELSLSSREIADMDFLAIDGTRLPVNSRLIARRWGPAFNILLREGVTALQSNATGNDAATLRPGASSLLSRNSSITITPSLSSTATTLTANTASSACSDLADARALPPMSRPRTLFLPHTVPTLQALLHYLYTSSLPPLSSSLATPQILCSLLQLAIPYAIDGILEAIIERLHEVLDGRNAAAIFNAAAMGAGGGKGISFASSVSGSGSHPPRTASLGGFEGLSLRHNGINGSDSLRIDTDMANGRGGSHAMRRGSAATAQTSHTSTTMVGNGYSDAGDDDDIPDSASTTHSIGSHFSTASQSSRIRREDREVWDGGWSAVIGLQKRGLRGLMEGRRAREGNGSAGPRGRMVSESMGGSTSNMSAVGVGLGIQKE